MSHKNTIRSNIDVASEAKLMFEGGQADRIYACPNKYKKELIETAKAIGRPGFGILAADESTRTCKARFDQINVECTHENRIFYRDMLFTTPDIEKHISGVIMYDETLKDNGLDGRPFPATLKERGIYSGIKVDIGHIPLAGTDGERVTQGLDGLGVRCAEYYKLGARFAKWRAVVTMGKNGPSDLSIRETAHTLARYGAICQEHGLVPIIEPEILPDGDHDIYAMCDASERVLTAVMKEMFNQNLLIEGTMLKPSMVTPGMGCSDRSSHEEIAWLTVRTLQRTIVPSLPTICFLSGGQSEEAASMNLSYMNKLDTAKPWSLTFSFGRALQKTVLEVWDGKLENKKAA